ncbi:MAG: hypothetical protein AB8U44_01960 [Aaplasma endosymbiont of Hyalomma asiaticum]
MVNQAAGRTYKWPAVFIKCRDQNKAGGMSKKLGGRFVLREV